MRFFTGRAITNMGDSLYLIGALWLVHDLTGSTLFTGVAGFLLRAPQLVQFLAGPLVDRWDLRRTLVATQILQGVFVLVIPLASLFDLLTVWVVIGVIPTLSLISRLQYPAQSATLPQIVRDDQLVRANSLFNLTGRTADIAFNAGAGVLIALVGAVQLFIIDAATFAIATVLFLGITIDESGGEEQGETGESNGSEKDEDGESDEDFLDSYIRDLKDGVSYMRGSLFIPIGIGGMVANFGAGVTTAVFPAFADSFGGAETYGILMATIVAGNLAGAAGSWIVEDLPYGLFAIGGYTVTGVATAAAVFFRGPLVTPALLFISFIPVGAFNVLLGSLLQSAVDDDYLGRVSSAFSSLTMVTLPLGSLVGGVVGDVFTPGSGLYLIGGTVLALALFFALNSQIRGLPRVADLDAEQVGLGTDTS
jgi:MFS family permease